MSGLIIKRSVGIVLGTGVTYMWHCPRVRYTMSGPIIQECVDILQGASRPYWGCPDSSMAGGYVETYVIDVNTSHTPEEGAHSPSWPNGLVIIISIKQSVGVWDAQDSLFRGSSWDSPVSTTPAGSCRLRKSFRSLLKSMGPGCCEVPERYNVRRCNNEWSCQGV
jgi:hypothetical protein